VAMYFTKQEFQVRVGGAADWEAFASKLFDLMQKQGGLERASNLNSLGYPNKYTIVALWDSREQARDFGRSAALTKLLAETRPQEIAMPLTPIEAFEVVHRVGGGHGAKAGYIIDQRIESGPGRVQAYEDARLKLFQLRQQHGKGFVVNILARFLGGGNRYLVMGAFTDAESEAATAEAPELVQYWKDYGPATIPIATESREPYEFVTVAGRAPVPQA
jgi:heme-degrading monooxygenase HmoA